MFWGLVCELSLPSNLAGIILIDLTLMHRGELLAPLCF